MSKRWIDQKTSFLKVFSKTIADDKHKREELKQKRLARAREAKPAKDCTSDVEMAEAGQSGDEDCDQNMEPEVFVPMPLQTAPGPASVGPLGREFVEEVLGGDLGGDEMGPSFSDGLGRDLLLSGRLKLYCKVAHEVPPQGLLSWLFGVVMLSTADAEICAAFSMLKEVWAPGCWAPSPGLLLQALRGLGQRGFRNVRKVLELIGIFHGVPLQGGCTEWDEETTLGLLTMIFRLLLHPEAGSVEGEIWAAAGALLGDCTQDPTVDMHPGFSARLVASLLSLGSHRSQLRLLEFVDRTGIGIQPPLSLRRQYGSMLLAKLMKGACKVDIADPTHHDEDPVESVLPAFSAAAILAACKGQDGQMDWWKMDTILHCMELLLHEDVEEILSLKKVFSSDVVNKLVSFVLKQPRRCDNVGLAQVSLRIQGMDGM